MWSIFMQCIRLFAAIPILFLGLVTKIRLKKHDVNARNICARIQKDCKYERETPGIIFFSSKNTVIFQKKKKKKKANGRGDHKSHSKSRHIFPFYFILFWSYIMTGHNKTLYTEVREKEIRSCRGQRVIFTWRSRICEAIVLSSHSDHSDRAITE